MDDNMFPPSDEGKEDFVAGGDISLPSEDITSVEAETPETKKEEPKAESKKEEAKELEGMTPEEQAKEKKETPADEKKEEEEEELDLGDLLDQLSDNEDSLKKTEDAIVNIEKSGTASDEDIATIKEENARMTDSLKRMEDALRKVSGEKSDLMFKNAELEAFGGESTNPQVLILSRNLEKANAGDDRSKSKVISVLKDMLEGFTGENYDSKKTEKKADLLSAVESYNSGANPNIKSKKDQEDNVLVM